MKRIGIITFHCAENYGAFLQTYASSEALKQLFPKLDVSVVNYSPPFLKGQNQINPFSWIKKESGPVDNIKSVCLYLITVPDRLQKKVRFLMARREIPISSPAFSSARSYHGQSYDYFYLGSDQIWNPEITHGIDPAYFGALHGCDSTIKLSYAASFGGASFDDISLDVLRLYLDSVDKISVRESSSQSFVADLVGKEAYVVVDPVLLLDPAVWYRHTNKRLYKHRYVLAYQLRDNPFLLNQAREYANKTGSVLLHFGDRSLSEFIDSTLKCVASAGPFEFISYIRYAEAIFTDSFHATCFSLIFERPFFSYLHKTRSERIIDLGASLGFSDFIVPCGKPADLNAITSIPIAAKSELSKHRAESQSFLRQALGEVGI